MADMFPKSRQSVALDLSPNIFLGYKIARLSARCKSQGENKFEATSSVRCKLQTPLSFPAKRNETERGPVEQRCNQRPHFPLVGGFPILDTSLLAKVPPPESAISDPPERRRRQPPMRSWGRSGGSESRSFPSNPRIRN